MSPSRLTFFQWTNRLKLSFYLYLFGGRWNRRDLQWLPAPRYLLDYNPLLWIQQRTQMHQQPHDWEIPRLPLKCSGGRVSLISTFWCVSWLIFSSCLLSRLVHPGLWEVLLQGERRWSQGSWSSGLGKTRRCSGQDILQELGQVCDWQPCFGGLQGQFQRTS